MRKKKLISYIILLVLTVALATGCSAESSVNSSNSTSPSEYDKSTTEDNTIDDLSNTASETVTNDYQETTEATEYTDSSAEESEAFEVHVLDVGQGLSVLIEADGHYMIYDGGGRNYSSYVVAYLKENNITELDYLVASHYDEDHINGLVGVLNTTTVEIALTPDYETDSDIYFSFCNMLTSNGAEEIHPSSGDTYMLGNAEIQIINADNIYSDDNNKSIVMRIVYGDFSVLLTGDAEMEAEEDMLLSGCNLDSDLYIVGHHGSSSSTSSAFVNAVSPSYAVISAGEGNSYGHPHKETMATLKAANVKLYRTDLQGEIICYSDGTNVRFNVDSTDNWKSGNELNSSEAAMSEETFSEAASGEEQEYVLNTNTGKFHYPDCSSAAQIKEKNKEIVIATREELIKEGYSPCGNCNP